MTSFYTVYGLSIESVIPLHGVLSSVERTDEADVVIRRGECSAEADYDPNYDHLEFGREKCFFYWANLGSMCLLEGREILLQPQTGVAEHLLRPFLISGALPILLYQRDLLVIHASSVAMQNDFELPGAVAFLGMSGQGKSTMATALVKSGHHPLSDDVIAVPVKSQIPRHNQNINFTPRVYAGPPHLKLRPPSLVAFNENAQSLSRWGNIDESRVIPVVSPWITTPVPLRCLYSLEDGASIRADLLEAEDALMKLSENSYGVRLLSGQEMGDNFLQCSQLVRSVPIFRLQRPRDFKRLPDVVRFVEEHQKTLKITV